MREIALALFAFLAFLLPVAVYCFILAAVNRRSRPLLVRGSWDAIGLLSALAGFFLATLPVIGFVFMDRVLGPGALGWGAFIVTIIYYPVLVCGAVLMVLARVNKTVIYNVDTELFSQAASQTFAALGLSAAADRNRLVLTPIPENDVDSSAVTEKPRLATAAGTRHAEVSVESFAAMSHITLHWGPCSPGIRAELERELRKNLETAAPLDNAAAGWFVSISGMIFGAILVMAAFFAFIVYFSRH
ncbi:MAG TPA: hypothetical protein VFE62_10525 [Gemmataceae bacterium]|nr:hypothetical protein [Gemmataceae bacterium]